MALRTSITINFHGDPIAFDCYSEVVNLTGSKGTMTAYLCHRKWTDRDEVINVDNIDFNPSVEDGAPNNFKQAYEHIKSAGLYPGSTDC